MSYKYCRSFTHHSLLLEKIKDINNRYYYIHRIAEEHLSVERLKFLISTNAHEQRNLPNNFSATLTSSNMARKAITMFKDEYLLDFINVENIGERDRDDIDERIVEQNIIHNIRNFIMTLGSDFAFIGNQFNLEVYGDVLFDNT